MWLKTIVTAPVRLVQKGKEKAMRDIVLGMVRHGLTTLGGMLVARGYMDAGQLEPVIGAMVVIVGVAWSAIEKQQRAKLVAGVHRAGWIVGTDQHDGARALAQSCRCIRGIGHALSVRPKRQVHRPHALHLAPHLMIEVERQR